jgi:hypothetical protein
LWSRGRSSIPRKVFFAEATSAPRFRMRKSTATIWKPGKKPIPSLPPMRTSIPKASEAAASSRGLSAFISRKKTSAPAARMRSARSPPAAKRAIFRLLAIRSLSRPTPAAASLSLPIDGVLSIDFLYVDVPPLHVRMDQSHADPLADIGPFDAGDGGPVFLVLQPAGGRIPRVLTR